METLIPNSVDASIEKHVPTYEKNGDKFVKIEEGIIQDKNKTAVDVNNEKSEQSVKYFTAQNWTLEYALFKSTSITTAFQKVCKTIHSRTDWEKDFEKTLAKKLIDKNSKLKKTEVAYRLANVLDEDLEKTVHEKTIIIDPDNEDDSINYLIQAIRYATGN